MNAPILTETELLRVAGDERAHRKSIAFANGVFDVLHVGHIRYLQEASKEADVLIVGVNGDDSVRAIKGEGRPVTPEHERAELVAAIRGVSYVTIFHDSSPSRLIAVLKPDVHCKGTDYAAFFSVQSAQKAKLYDKEAANANARLSTQLPYI
ncbi:MAG TPA: adenylyltransferase/cytidyltransferase family protein, partial [Thermoanaerobaculia bacterium]